MEAYQVLENLKWQGKVSARLVGPTADQAWSHLKHFCSLHKWVTEVHTCYKLQGSDGQPGCTRYCAGPASCSSDPSEPVGWSKERLIVFDEVGRSYSYELVETNKGFGRYVATMGVVPDAEGCLLEWSFEADPIRGWSREGFVSCLQGMAQGVAENVTKKVVGDSCDQDKECETERESFIRKVFGRQVT